MEPPAALALLPDDVLAAILTRLAPRDLAIARAVCRPWRAVIDGRRLLRANLLPLSLGGIFILFHLHRFSEYFFEPLATPTISSMTDYMPYSKRDDYFRYVEGHCNGLLLLYGGYVVNPATQGWTQLPPSSHTQSKEFRYHNYLMFDPTLSSHYEVFSIPRNYYGDDELMEKSEWPPLSCIMHVFSSRTSEWEERQFVRAGDAIGTVSMLRKYMGRNSAVYYRRALYVHYQTNVLLRISLSNGKYQAIKPPSPTYINKILRLGKSRDGVYFAHLGSPIVEGDAARLRIWVLRESCGQTEWLLKYCADLRCALRENLGSWVLQNVNFNYHRDHFTNYKEEPHMEDGAQERDDHGSLRFLGFHPFEKVVFLCRSLRWGLAYHLNDSKLQYLGYLYPTKYRDIAEVSELVLQSDTYTPCWM